MTQKAKTKYSIRYWHQYNRALEQRGSLTICFSSESIEKLIAKKDGKQGRPYLYSNDAILCALMLKAVYHLPLLERGYGDGAYDKEGCYWVFHGRGIEPIIPPQKNGVLHEDEIWMKPRNDAIKEITGLGGDQDARKLWKRLKEYHLRSIAETAMYRFKTLFGGLYLPFVTDAIIIHYGGERKAFATSIVEFFDSIAQGIGTSIPLVATNIGLGVLVSIPIVFAVMALFFLTATLIQKFVVRDSG